MLSFLIKLVLFFYLLYLAFSLLRRFVVYKLRRALQTMLDGANEVHVPSSRPRSGTRDADVIDICPRCGEVMADHHRCKP